MTSATIGVVGMVDAGMVGPEGAAGAAPQWALGDLLGLASTAPSRCTCLAAG